jgi:hypothetical protein
VTELAGLIEEKVKNLNKKNRNILKKSVATTSW